MLEPTPPSSELSATVPGNARCAAPSAWMHAALEAIVTVDESMHIAMVNPAAERMFGRPAAQLLGCHLEVLLPQRLRDVHSRHVADFIGSEERERPMGQRGKLTGLRANGQEFPIEATICKVDMAASNGTQRCFTALLYDLSEVEQLRVFAERLNRRMESLFDLVPAAVCTLDGDAVVYANRACAQLFHCGSVQTMVGRCIEMCVSPADQPRVKRWLRSQQENDAQATSLNCTIERCDGTHGDVEMVALAVPEPGSHLLQVVMNDVTRVSNEKRQLAASRRTLRALSVSLVEAREAERQRIAHELHDELGQRLTALKLELAALGTEGSAVARRRRIAAMTDLVDDTVAATRRIWMDLRPLMLDDLGLNAAIEWQTQQFERRTGIEVELQLTPEPDSLSARTKITLYRIVQESLTNVARHAFASRVQVSTRRRSDHIELTVRDNGRGTSVPDGSANHGSFGLLGMRERVISLGGRLRVGNGAAGGFQVSVTLPLSEAVDAVPDEPSVDTSRSTETQRYRPVRDKR